MKRIVVPAVAAALALAAGTARADSFAAGSLIIPMDTSYQDSGMLQAYGLIYNLLSHGVPVRWIINPAKQYQGVDFTASATDLKTSAVVTNNGYRGGPFIIDSSNAAAAVPLIQAWWKIHTTNLVTVHTASATFMAPVNKVLVAAPRVGINGDGNQGIAIGYLNAAAIPDSQGNAWPNTSPDILTPAQVAGPTTTNHCDGALFDSNCIPKYCQFMSMHWDVNAAALSPETVWEVRTFLTNPTHFYAECQAVDAFEDTVEVGQNGLPGHFLTTNGLAFGPQPKSVDYYNPTLTFAQIDGTFGTVGGSEPSYALAPGSQYKVGGIVMLTGVGVAPAMGQDVWMTGFLDGACPPGDEICGSLGKVSYLGGHQYNTNVPISKNPQTQGVRLFLNSLFDSVCASASGFPSMSVVKSGPTGTTSSTVTYTIGYSDGGPIAALNAVLTDTLPAGATFVSASNGGTFSGGTVTWKLGDLAASSAGTVSLTVTLPAYGTYDNTANLAFNVGINTFTQPSNQVSTLYAACIGDYDCPSTAPICDPTTHVCRACKTNADCAGQIFPVCDTLAGSPNLGSCVQCISDASCASPTPRCDLGANDCVQCLSATDCGGMMPTCNASNVCQSCTTDASCGGATPACEPWGACGQCSTSNQTQCSGATKVCDTSKGSCVGCDSNADCSGTTPVCNTATNGCQPCQTDADCTGSPSGGACATSGMKQGQCVACTGDASCGGATPKCDTVSNVCVACLANADCPSSTPACNPATQTCVGCLSSADCPATAPICDGATMTCGACAADYSPTPATGACPTPALPACQPQGSTLAGECTQCSATNATVCAASPGTPVCVGNAVCGCTKDTDCAAGTYCDTAQVATGFCQPGCQVVSGMSNCPAGQTCSQQNGTVGVCQGASSSSSTSTGTSTGTSTSTSTGTSTGTGGASASSSGSTTSGMGGASGATSGSTTSGSGNASGAGGSMGSSSSRASGSGTGSGMSTSGNGGAGGSGGGSVNGPGSQGSCSCRTAPADDSPLRFAALLGVAGVALRRRARPRRAAR